MSHPLAALRAAVRARLLADAPLLALLGGPRLHDALPRGGEEPFLLFADAGCRDWSTGEARGWDARLTLHAHARDGGPARALALIERAALLLDDADLSLPGHRLVELRVAALDLARVKDPAPHRAGLTLRALVEQGA